MTEDLVRQRWTYDVTGWVLLVMAAVLFSTLFWVRTELITGFTVTGFVIGIAGVFCIGRAAEIQEDIDRKARR